jgi:uncharacterized iron-regulated membrane protein
MDTTTLATARRWPLRRILHTIHLWIGLLLGIPLVLIGLTGSVLVFEGELRELINAQHATLGEPRPPSEIVAAARKAAPDAEPTFLILPEDAGGFASVRFAVLGRSPGPGGLQVLVDPVSLDTSAPRSANSGWLRQVFNLHAQLFVPGREGRRLAGWFGVAMVALGISGMVMWWPRGGRWKAALTVDRRARGARLLRELHGAVGIWCWVVFMTVSVSSVYLTFPQTVGDAVRTVLPGRDLRAAAPRVTPLDGALPLDIDTAVAIARSEAPESTLRMIVLPQRPDQAYRIGLAPPEHRHGTPPITAYVDPWAGGIVEIRDPRNYTLGEKLLAWQHAVHAGDGFGWPWRLLVFVSGLLPALFVGTGVSLWFLRRRRARQAARPL